MLLVPTKGPLRTLQGETVPQAALAASSPASGFAVVGNGWSTHGSFPSDSAIRTHVGTDGEATVLRAVALLGNTVLWRPMLRAVDERIRKALDPNDARDLAVMIEREGRRLTRRSKPILDEFYRSVFEELDASWVGLPPVEREAVLRGVLAGMDDRFPEETLQELLHPSIETNSGKVVRRSAKGFQDTHNLPKVFSWTSTDAELATTLADSSVNYVRTINDTISDSGSKLARKMVADGLKAGLSNEEIAFSLQKELAVTTGRTNIVYWRTVASTYITRSRSWGHLTTMDRGGFTEYQIVAVLDEVTTPTCFAPWTAVRTPEGDKRIDELRPGDDVITGLGQRNKIRAVSRRRASECLVISALSGRTLTVTAEHPIMTSDGWKKAEDIEEGDQIAVGQDVHVQGLRSTVHGSIQEKELLHGPMLPRVQKGADLGHPVLRSLQEDVQDTKDLRGERFCSALLEQLPEEGCQEGIDDQAVDAQLQILRAGIPHLPRRILERKDSSALLPGMPAAAPYSHVRDVWGRIRETAAPEAAVLLDGLLSTIEVSLSAGDACGAHPHAVRHSPRSGVQTGQLLDRLPAERFRNRARSGRGILARQEGAIRVEGQEGTDDCRRRFYPDPRANHFVEEQRGEGSVEAYTACATGWDRIVSVQRIRLTSPLPVYNLEIDGDPTYIAEGIVVHNCRFLHGKRFRVGAGLATFGKLAALRTLDDIKFVQPWFRSSRGAGGLHSLIIRNKAGRNLPVATETRSGFGTVGDVGSWTTQQFGSTGAMMVLNVGPPPYHGGCRTTSIPVFGPGVRVPRR